MGYDVVVEKGAEHHRAHKDSEDEAEGEIWGRVRRGLGKGESK